MSCHDRRPVCHKCSHALSQGIAKVAPEGLHLVSRGVTFAQKFLASRVTVGQVRRPMHFTVAIYKQKRGPIFGTAFGTKTGSPTEVEQYLRNKNRERFLTPFLGTLLGPNLVSSFIYLLAPAPKFSPQLCSGVGHGSNARQCQEDP
jgi:hypothetical protein